MADAETCRTAGTGDVAPAARRVLMLRSCRAPQFEAAVRAVRERYPDAQITALTHAGHADTLSAAGVDAIVEVPGRRFSVFRTSPVVLGRLRRERFDEVVVPQMTHYADVHTNLYWVVLALFPNRVTLIPADAAPVTFGDVSAFCSFVLQNSFSSLLTLCDTPIFLGLLLAAAVRRRPAPRPAPDRRRRILYVISSLGVGGAQVQLAEVLNRLPADEYEADLLVLGNSDGEFSRQWLKRDDIDITFLKQWPRMTLSVLEIIARCRSRQYDMVHTWLFMANITAVAAARLAGVPVVISAVRNLSVWKREDWYRKWWFRPADVLSAHASDVVTVNATALVADHARWALVPRSRIEVVHNGLDPAHFTVSHDAARQRLLELTQAPAAARFVGIVGRLAPEKDQRTFLAVLARVRSARPDVHGVVIGNGQLRDALEAEASRLGLTGGITFLGERADARALMAGFDLFALTSLSEGFPNVLLEATFLGVPCIATDIAGNPDVLAARAALFPAGDGAAGAACALDALAAPVATAARARAARVRALNLFTAERSVATWFGLYRRLLHGTSDRAAGRAALTTTLRTSGAEDR